MSWNKTIQLPAHYSSLTPTQRAIVRNAYIKQQNKLCYWCNSSLDDEPPVDIRNMHINWSLFPPHFLRHPIHLQHDHRTDLTEGAVHALCNAVMWQYYGR